MVERDEITGVGPEDFDRLVELWEASVRATHDFVAEADIVRFRPLVRDALPQIPTFACVRDVDGRVAGFVAVSDRKVHMLFIDPARRGQGLRRRLLEHAVQVLGASTLDVNEQNEQAVGFYLRLGFEVVGRSPVDDTGNPYPLLHMRLRPGRCG
ncbi:MAG: acetyltransferase [Chloroflexota bacterium]|nr:acetyltransferase [Chloroflexota bacterium]